jgi:hypothetical protein
MSLYGVTKTEQKAKVKAGAVYIATCDEYRYGAIAVGTTEAQARRLCIAKVRKNFAPGFTASTETIDSGVRVYLLAPGETETT